MDGPRLDRLPLFTTICRQEKNNVLDSLKHPLSGYLGGQRRTGYWVKCLQGEWELAFGVRYAIACNSATSGLLAACMAIGIKPGDKVWVSTYTMSATAACAAVLGADVITLDIEPYRFSLALSSGNSLGIPKAIIVTNLFGHPAYLYMLRKWCDKNSVYLIEDNAQAPFSMENGKYAGTIGHIGVFSLNVHKHIQCGEGGIITTSDSGIADSLYGAINHGELAAHSPGLNLRMTEPIAAIACAQLKRAKSIIAGRIEIAEYLNESVKGCSWIDAPFARPGCKHVYYLWTPLLTKELAIPFVKVLRKCGFPIKNGYSPLLNKIFHRGVPDNKWCPVAEEIDSKIVVYENCMYDPKTRHLKKMRDIIHYAIDQLSGGSNEGKTSMRRMRKKNSRPKTRNRENV